MSFAKRKQSAFTLIELLIVTLILAVVTGAVAACFSGGLRAWDSVQNFNEMELNVLPALELLEKDLKNSFDFYDIEFNGDDQMMEFAGLIPDNRVQYGERIARIKYSYFKSDESIVRDVWAYPGDELTASDAVMSDIEDVHMEYYYATEGGDGVSGWGAFRSEGTNFLNGVRMTLDLKGGKNAEITRTIIFPVGKVQRPRQTGGIKP